MKQIPNEFTSYELEPEETIQSRCFNALNIAMLSTMRANFATEKLLLPVDTTNIQSYLQKEAELQGQIRILTLLIDESNEAQKQIVL